MDQLIATDHIESDRSGRKRSTGWNPTRCATVENVGTWTAYPRYHSQRSVPLFSEMIIRSMITPFNDHSFRHISNRTLHLYVANETFRGEYSSDDFSDRLLDLFMVPPRRTLDAYIVTKCVSFFHLYHYVSSFR
ncbi:hypothetical protein Tcan_06541 [Toxocara canis]|uniref:Uncharacterized protein n=1 Tax=Toxocara canis TaxID=6265 RepID=A0A0B2VDF7_TOXCA|nr:hypothetical protein Tcan_06541 [Toxocara canis]